MSMICKHGGNIVDCTKCEDERKEKIILRRELLLRSFNGWIDTGFWGDIDAGVGKLYHAIYRKNQC